MTLEEFLNHIYQLGFVPYDRDKGKVTKRYPFVDMSGIGLLYLEVFGEIDYYTSWYGNHPKKYVISFVNEYKLFSRELSDIRSIKELTDHIDQLFLQYQNSSAKKIYDNRKKSILRNDRLDSLLSE